MNYSFKDQWVLLWSQSQGGFHIETAVDMLKSNAAAFRANRRMDYVPLCLGSRDECDRMADSLRPVVRQRAEMDRA